jgi:hypothetical protein
MTTDTEFSPSPEIPQDFLNYMHDKAHEAGDNLIIFADQKVPYTAGYKAGGIKAYRYLLEMATAANQRYSDTILDVRKIQKELATIKEVYALCVDERREQAKEIEALKEELKRLRHSNLSPEAQEALARSAESLKYILDKEKAEEKSPSVGDVIGDSEL